jgi:hypothetical protein
MILISIGLLGRILFVLNRSKLLLDDRFALTVGNVGSSISSFNLSLLFTIIIKSPIAEIMIVLSIFGVSIGVLFGSFVKLHFIISSGFNGFFSALMGVMIGAVLLNPSLCSLPLNPVQIEENILLICIFSFILFVATFFLLKKSFYI